VIACPTIAYMLTVVPRAQNAVERCPQAETCSLLPLYGLRGTLPVLRATFCDGQYDRCARYRVTQLGRIVPSNLLPNGRAIAGYVPVR
jgi:hypothetical protein